MEGRTSLRSAGAMEPVSTPSIQASSKNQIDVPTPTEMVTDALKSARVSLLTATPMPLQGLAPSIF
jgi:hypothetical protein